METLLLFRGLYIDMVRCSACDNGNFKRDSVQGKELDGAWFCERCSQTYSDEELREFAS